jgi:general secretion pathway protein K
MTHGKQAVNIIANERGMALLITIMTVSLLVAITVQFHKTTWQKYQVSSNYKTGARLKVIADSGINIGLALLEQDSTENSFDSLLDTWKAVDQGDFSDLFAGGELQLTITDLTGRLQVNSLVRKSKKSEDREQDRLLEEEMRAIFTRLLLSGSFPVEDEVEARVIVDSLVDWIDEDDRESDDGAESSYYQSLENPYSCRNGPVQYIEEMLLVRGITRQLLFGTKESEGLADYLTVYGEDGRININTAPVLILQSLHSLVSDEMVENLDSYRTDIGNQESLADISWYRSSDGWPGDIIFEDKLLTSVSSYFRITAIGQFDTFSRRVVALAQRAEEGEMRLLGRKVE